MPSEESPSSGDSRDPPAARLQSHEPAARSGDADRAAAVVAMRDGDDPGGDGSGGAAGGAAGRALEVPGVARRAEQARLGDREDAVLGERRGSHDHEAGVLQPPRDVVVVLGDVARHQRAAIGQAQALHRTVVLDGRGHARERAGVARGDLLGGGERALGVHLDERVERGIEFLDPLERQLDELSRRHLAGAHHARQLARSTEQQVLV